MQTILGAGGPIGNELAKALPKYTNQIRLVSRNPKKVNPSDELMPADLLQEQQVLQAVEGSSVVYLVVGFPYQAKAWQAMWPLAIHNTIKACQAQGCKLVFFDNVYMYDPAHIPHMTEETPFNPKGKKGNVRMEITNLLLKAIQEKRVEALIARSADFYGAHAPLSMLGLTVLKPLSQGKKADVLISPNFKHSFTYNPDAGRALALLGNTPDAYQQTWHLPTDKNSWTIMEWIEQAAQAFGTKPQYRVASKGMVRILGLFNKGLRETYEMLYQYDQPYFFDSSKFDNRFDFHTTSYQNGLKEIIRLEYS